MGYTKTDIRILNIYSTSYVHTQWIFVGTPKTCTHKIYKNGYIRILNIYSTSYVHTQWIFLGTPKTFIHRIYKYGYTNIEYL